MKKLGFLLFGVIIVFSMLLPSFLVLNNPGLPEFDPYYYEAIADRIIQDQKVFLTDQLSLRLDKETYTLPLYPLEVSLLSMFTSLNTELSLKLFHLLTLALILFFVFVITRAIYDSKTAFITALLIFSVSFLLTRLLLPIREFVNLLFFLFLLYILILYKKEFISKGVLISLIVLILLASLILYPVFPLVFLITSLIFIFEFKFLTKKRLAYISFIILLFSVLFFLKPFRTFFDRSFFYYLSQISGVEFLPIQYYITSYGLIPLLFLVLSLVVFIKSYTPERMRVHNKLIIILIGFAFTTLMVSPLSNRIYLYSSFILILFFPLFFQRTFYSRHFKVLCISLLIISMLNFNFMQHGVWVTNDEKKACSWFDSNAPSDIIILTPRGTSYLLMPFCKRPVYGYDILLSKDFTLDNAPNKILEFSDALKKRFGKETYLFISKEKLLDSRYKEEYLYGLDLHLFYQSKSYTKFYEDEKAVIFKIQ